MTIEKFSIAPPEKTLKFIDGTVNEIILQIDEVMIFDRVLSVEEIGILYSSRMERINATNWNFYFNKSHL